jgi:putative redox protein
VTTTESQDERFLTTFSSGGRQAAADVTAEYGGAGAGFRPHELLEAALATCVNMTVRVYAEAHAIVIGEVRTRVEVDRSTPDETVFRYGVEIDGATPEEKERLLRAARACPVRKTLSQTIRFEGFDGA